MRRGVIRIQLHRFAQRRFRLLAQALVAERYAEIILNLRVLRIEPGRMAQRVERVVIFLLLEFQIAKER